MNNKSKHNFHIPIMGLGFTIDTPVKVAQYGISSVISIIDDVLIENMREIYSGKFKIPFEPIPQKSEDSRAKRITAYLNLVNKIVIEKFDELKNSLNKDSKDLQKYQELLPDNSIFKQKINDFLESKNKEEDLKSWIQNNLSAGSIDVNIMTKVDKDNYDENGKLPVQFNDAHSALRGFAKSNLRSSIVLSAGINPRLYGYFEEFEDFYPDENGELKKKIILKVSDYRSAIIQGKFLAKKGLWVSEYRIESGLNCGGHAFTSDGYLMGPILDEFRVNREALIETIFKIYILALKNKNKICPQKPLDVKITAQGGIGTSDEHQFLLEYYKLDSIGWATPFLLVPEVTNVDDHTRKMLTEAKEKDLYLSKISPLGVPFNNLKGNTKDIEKQMLVDKGRPGSQCSKKFLVSNTEFTDKTICTASRQYQKIKLKQLETGAQKPEEQKEHYNKIVDRSCLCTGLAASAMIVNDVKMKTKDRAVSICPGPNMAYFSEIVSLKKMTDHIYGRANIIKRDDRPNMFIKELSLYIDYLKEKNDDLPKPISEKELKYFLTCQKNIQDGIDYYKYLFSEIMVKTEESKIDRLNKLAILERELNSIELEPAEEFTPELHLVNSG